MSKAHFVPSLVSWFSELGLHILGGEEFLLCMQSMGGFERIKFKRIQRNFESGNLT